MANEIIEKLRRLDIALVMDVTNSMSACLKEAKSKLVDLIMSISQTALAPRVALSLVTYTDHDVWGARPSEIVCPLTDGLDIIQKSVSRLKLFGGGQTFPEAVADGLASALELSWREMSHRLLVLVGDAPPRGETQCVCGIDMQALIKKITEKRVTVLAVGCPGPGGSWWKSSQPCRYVHGAEYDTDMVKHFSMLAEQTGGAFVYLTECGSLMDSVMSLLDRELEKLKDDITVFQTLTEKSTFTLAEVALATGRSETQVREATKRLEGKTGRILLQPETNRICPNCHFRNRPMARFCSRCGTSI
jgi:Mg-chelatase subunit ChlD